jgi:hypothetical protein
MANLENHVLTKSSIKRKLYHKANNYNWRVRTVESKTNLIKCSKEYKKVLNTQFHLYNRNLLIN